MGVCDDLVGVCDDFVGLHDDFVGLHDDFVGLYDFVDACGTPSGVTGGSLVDECDAFVSVRPVLLDVCWVLPAAPGSLMGVPDAILFAQDTLWADCDTQSYGRFLVAPLLVTVSEQSL